MKLSTKIFIVLFVITLVPTFFLGRFIIAGIKPVDGGFTFNFGVWAYVAIADFILNNIFGGILFFRFLRTQPLSKVLFFSTVPLSVGYAVSLFVLADLNRYSSETAESVRTILNISKDNSYNTILWAVLLSIAYVLIVFFLYLFICRPVTRIEKIVSRLSDGRMKEDSFNIGKSKQFQSVEHSLNKINYQYKEKDNALKKTNLEAQKFIPKQFFKFLGKNNIGELELGNQVKKTATTLFCNLKGTSNKDLSLEENFNYINSYLHVVSPIIRRFDGFVDKYLGEGILAVFSRPESAVEAAHSIIRALEIKNKSNKDMPPVEASISIHTGEVIFGVVGEEERKCPTIVSDVVELASKIEDVNAFLHTNLIFTKSVLNEIPSKFRFNYRYLGSLNLDEGTSLALYESTETYPREMREKLAKEKSRFEEAVRLYNDGNYNQASSIFEEILHIIPEDKPSYIYFNKAREKAGDN